MHPPTIISCGEVLWDLFPDGAKFGGAPANFAAHAARLGARVSMLSAVGADERGDEALRLLRQHGIATHLVSTLADARTGSVGVSLDAAGRPRYEIHADAAWDRLAWTPGLDEAIHQAEAIYFGTLGQRDARSRETLRRALSLATGLGRLRMLDVNLRAPFFSAELICESIAHASHLKLSEEEAPQILAATACRSMEHLRERFGLRLIALTRGPEGAWIITAERSLDLPGRCVTVADTVGAGDAFSAALLTSLLRQTSLEDAAESALHLSSQTCTHPGALPP